ncbi:MAG: 2-hydroxyacid dehydrogenase [Ruminococcaceae bacterium]|nr:2-hydroxyacid dehydrogenase [Oscillospiraceae bacterium]
MYKAAFFDTKPYDRKWFDALKDKYGIKIKYLENRLNSDTAVLASGYEAVVAFVSDTIDKDTVAELKRIGVKAIAMRCAGFNNVDLKACGDDIKVYRVPAYSPASVAEHAMALLLTLNRKIHRAYNRTREFNFSLKGLIGFDLKGKTVGVVGMGKIGQCFVDICLGFGMKVIAYDLYPTEYKGVEYVSIDELFRRSDVISLHCPLTSDTYHIMDKEAFSIMKDGVYVINTSRGALIDSEALLEAIKSGKVGGAGLDVYEEETDLFYEDFSDQVLQDDMLNMLSSQPNVLITSHQAFLTNEALEAIAETTLENLKCYFEGCDSKNLIK